MDTEREHELIAIVRNNYQTIAPDFAAKRERPLWPEIARLAASVPAGASVLDVGCGNGRLYRALAGRDIAYLGIDPNRALIDWARKKHAGVGIEFHHGDLLAPSSLPSSQFEWIFAIAVLHHLPGRERRAAALIEMVKRLKPEGRLVISVWDLWVRPRERRALLRNLGKKLIGRYPYDWNDLVFPWKDSSGQAVSERYYHAFTRGELGRLARRTSAKIDCLYQDGYNYYLILRK